MKNQIREAFDDIKAEDSLIEATKKTVNERRGKKAHNRVSVIAAPLIALAIIVIIIFGSMQMYAKETAFIDIDVNPSIELKVNSFDRVVGAYAYNKDGEKVLASLEVENKTYTDAVEELIKVMTDQGYLDNDGLISVTLQTENKNKRASQLTSLKTTINSVLKKNKSNVTEEVFSVGHATKVHSHEENVSPAKYLAIKELQKYDSQTTVEECREHSISDIRNQTNEHHQKKTDSGNTETGGHKEKHSGENH